MKGVLRWLFGPDFYFDPAGHAARPLRRRRRAVKSPFDLWTRTLLRHGHLIQFLHQAIEWENVLYFLYPYFWSRPLPLGPEEAPRAPRPDRIARSSSAAARGWS